LITGNVAYPTVANSLRSGLGSGQPVTIGAGRALSRELAASGGLEDCLDEQADVAVVDAGERDVAQLNQAAINSLPADR